MSLSCPFCALDPERIFFEGKLIIGLWDFYPVSPGHALLVTRRHVPTWFEAYAEEQIELMAGVIIARAKIEEHFTPDGYNIGINVGEAAGQTIDHLHLHVIPRYRGDVPNPRGGVRFVIPEKANYPDSSVDAALGAVDQPPDLPHGGALITGGEDQLFAHLRAHLNLASRADLAVAFVFEGGLRLIEEHLRDLLDRGGHVRMLAGDYLSATEPNALLRLLDLAQEYPESVQVRIFECGEESFHPKTYIFYGDLGAGVAFVGSSNLTQMALTRGIEWNYRVVPVRDHAGFNDVVRAFESLFHHPLTKELDIAWIEEYRSRRKLEPAKPINILPVPNELVAPPPQPHEIQEEALAALQDSRSTGTTAGLVVLATGLGKTWLAAFDSVKGGFQRILFVAHREEILSQAMRTFRRIRPDTYLGRYTGEEKTPGADVLFASIQTLGKARHLELFEPEEFDYIVVDEFHHAAARTYRRLIDHFNPAFMLGLTATPERTDGGDLLALCQENLVYRCDLVDGIQRGLLSPFRYFGVPDEVDYSNIPWRSSKFDEQALTSAVATQSRAQNALEQYREKGGARTLAFCCSTRHASFMADFFTNAGIRAAAVHSAEHSAPRTTSLEKLQSGELEVVFAVDMFNEGVDLPNLDTIMMLRPTESRLLWLQQFGRGLRQVEGKERLTVIDYIGNHRCFLLKPQTLLSLQTGDMQVAHALDNLQAGRVELPPGCEVTYELEAINILRSLLRISSGVQAVRNYYEDFRETHGHRPSAVEAFHDGYNPRAVRSSYGSWLGFVDHMGDLDGLQRQSSTNRRGWQFLKVLETTQMTRSFKVLVLLAMLNEDSFPGEIALEALTAAFAKIARRSSILGQDVGSALNDPQTLESLLEKNPLNAWAGGKGTGGVSYFTYEDRRFRTALDVEEDERELFQEAARELADWRLAEYLSRDNVRQLPDEGQITCKISYSGKNPIMFLPDRAAESGIPYGWVPVSIENEWHEANFVKVAVNVVRRPESDENELPTILRRWFGPDAGRPGTRFRAAFEKIDDGFTLRPLGAVTEEDELRLWKSYFRDQVPTMFGHQFNTAIWNKGIVLTEKQLFLLVTLEKARMPQEHRYTDHFIDRDVFEWQSQNQTTQKGKHGQAILSHSKQGIEVHLFVRQHKKIQGRAAPFVYFGQIDFLSWEGGKADYGAMASTEFCARSPHEPRV